MTTPEPTFTAEDAAVLARLEAEFDAAGGRGVELADRIDALRARRNRAALDVTAETFEGDGDREYGWVHIGTDIVVTVYESLTEPGRVVVDIDQRPGSTTPLAVTVNDHYLLGGPA